MHFALISTTLLHLAFTGGPGQRLSLHDVVYLGQAAKKMVSGYSWLNENTYLHHRPTEDGFTVEAINIGDKKSRSYFSSDDLSAAFEKLTGFAQTPPDLFEEYHYNADKTALLFNIANDLFVYEIQTKTVKRLTNTSEPEVGEEFSPDGRTVSYIRNHNIWMADLESGVSRSVTHDGSAELMYGRLDWVYQEELYGRDNFKGYWWSPDGKHLAFLRIDESPVREFPVVDHLTTYPATEHTNYPKAGAPNPKASLGIIPTRGGNITWVDLSTYELAPFLIVGAGWTPDSGNVVFQVQDRIQTWLDLNLADVKTGAVTRVLKESSKDWVNRLMLNPFWLDNDSFLWLSERTGFMHIYQYSLKGGTPHQHTDGPWETREILAADASAVYFLGTKDTEIEEHIYRLDRQNGQTKRLTQTGYTHAASFAPKSKHFLDTWSNPITPPSLHLVSNKGETEKKIFTPKKEKVAALGLNPPEFLEVPTRDGFTMNAMLIKPPNFDPAKKYPVLEYNYSGPHSQSVCNAWDPRPRQLWNQYMAQQGYVIWICDNRSASGKGHRSEATSYLRLGIQELQDHLDGIAWLKQQPWVDQERIGIWGWSFGGTMTLLAMTRSNVYKVGISGAPVTDWHFYDSIYTERYMSTPQDNADGYAATSALRDADKLQGKLLLLHGLTDDNVHFQNSVHFLWETQKAGKHLDLMVYPRTRHTPGPEATLHIKQLMTNYIKENL